jgi:DNA-binding PadR family transcriptional regulator
VICYDISRYAKKKETDMTAFAISGRRHRGHDHVRLMSGARRGRRRRGHFGPGHAGFGRRAGRGDIRAAILALLTEQPMHGYQIIQELEARTDGAWRVSPGSIYPTLQVLEDVGLVRAEKASGKRVFHLTDEGREAAEAAGDRKPWDAVTDDLDNGLVALRDELFNVGAAALQVANAGNDGQVTAAKKVLADARRQLYLLLADVDADDPETPATDTTPES